MIDRRSFLKSGLAGAATIGLAGLLARPSLAKSALERGSANDDGGYGALQPTPTNNTGEVLLALPAGFSYNVFGRTGSSMTDGAPTPAAHDGMAAFQVHGKIRLVRNHEVRTAPGKSIGPGDLSYDPTAGGGTTTLEVDPVTRELVRDWISLSGTLVNCAGGPTPWGSWITCEETVAGLKPGQVYHQSDEQATYARNHGYCFEVSALEDGVQHVQPLKEMGRFVHEAIAVDPSTGIVYLTEDTRTAGFYRYIPNVPGRLAEGGKLQMMRVKGQPNYDTRTGQTAMKPIPVEWVDIQNPDPAEATEKPLAVYEQGIADGCAIFARLEGAWYGNGNIYIDSTSGGDQRLGQIFRYRPMGDAGGELTLLFESPNKDVLNAPDNLCISPRGGMAICEDGSGPQHVRGLTQDGRIFDFARNVASNGEFAGACFSPDGNTLFVNIQSPGMTFAIWGPWERGSF
jgi:uncharacterized protein